RGKSGFAGERPMSAYSRNSLDSPAYPERLSCGSLPSHGIASLRLEPMRLLRYNSFRDNIPSKNRREYGRKQELADGLSIGPKDLHVAFAQGSMPPALMPG